MIDKNIHSVWTLSKEITHNPDSNNIILFLNANGQICHARLNKPSKKSIHLIIGIEEMT
jgi:hypothetical protein